MKEKFSFEEPQINTELDGRKKRHKIEDRLERFEEILTNRLEGEPKPKKVTLEIGIGSAPFFLNPVRILNKKKWENIPPPALEKDELYIGLDIKEGEVRIAKQKYENGKPKIENLRKASFLVASGEKLPIKEGAADEIVLKEVIDAPNSYFKYKQRNFDPGRFLEILDPETSEFRDLPSFNDSSVKKFREYLQRTKARGFEELDEETQITLEGWFWSIEQDRAELEAKLNIVNEAKRALKEKGLLILINHTTTEISEEFFDKYLLHDQTLKKFGIQEIQATRFGKKYLMDYVDIFQKV